MLTRRHHRGGERWTLSVQILFIGSFLLAFSACSPKVIEKVRTEYVYQDVHHRDTTIVRDSVWLKEWIKGDTVYVDRYRDRYVYRDRWRDSVSIVEKHDTTSVEVKVEKPLSWGQKAKIGAFPWLLLALIGALLWIFRKYIF